MINIDEESKKFFTPMVMAGNISTLAYCERTSFICCDLVKATQTERARINTWEKRVMTRVMDDRGGYDGHYEFADDDDGETFKHSLSYVVLPGNRFRVCPFL